MKSTGILFALGMALLAWPSLAVADLYVQTSDHCSGTGCGTPPNNGNHILVTQDVQTGLTTFNVTLANGWAFVDTGANGSGGSLNFGFGSALTNLSVTNTSANGWNTTNGQFFVENGTPNNGSATSTVSTGSIAAANTFAFPNGIAIGCNSNGGSSPCSNTLSFTINTLAALTADTSGGAFFWADVINNNRAGSPTGLIDFGLAAVPLPGALPLFATGLGGLGLLGWRRKRKVQAA